MSKGWDWSCMAVIKMWSYRLTKKWSKIPRLTFPHLQRFLKLQLKVQSVTGFQGRLCLTIRIRKTVVNPPPRKEKDLSFASLILTLPPAPLILKQVPCSTSEWCRHRPRVSNHHPTGPQLHLLSWIVTWKPRHLFTAHVAAQVTILQLLEIQPSIFCPKIHVWIWSNKQATRYGVFWKVGGGGAVQILAYSKHSLHSFTNRLKHQ